MKKAGTHSSSCRLTAALAMLALAASPSCKGGPGEADRAPAPGPQLEDALAAGSSAAGSLPSGFNPDDQIDPSARVGSIPGALMVGPDGSSRFRIDFELSDEFAGNTPKLGLTYNGRMSGGDAGRGWSLSGPPSIARCPMSSVAGPYLDRPAGQALPTVGLRSPAGVEALTKHDLSDSDPDEELAAAGDRYSNLCLNGALIYQVPVGETSPPPKATRAFRVQGRPFARVFLMDNGRFEEHAESGLVRTYVGTRLARTRGGTISRSFALDSEQDRYGHTVNYEYAWDGDEHNNHRLTEVSYTGGRVELEWGAADERFGYSHGMRTSSTALLQRVLVYGGNDGLARTYELTHSESEFSGRDLLASATVCDREGVCLPATHFEYTEPEVATTTLRSMGGFGGEFPLTLTDAERETAAFADVDGDGVADLLYLTETSVILPGAELVLAIRHGVGSGRFLPAREHPVELPAGADRGAIDRTQLTFADITGDGLADPILISGFREQTSAGSGWSGVSVQALDASNRGSEITVKTSWRMGGARPWGCDFAYGCNGTQSGMGIDGVALLEDQNWTFGADFAGGAYFDAVSEIEEAPDGGGDDCWPPDLGDQCRAVATLGLTFMDLSGDGRDEVLPCVGFLDLGEGERSEPYWGNAADLFLHTVGGPEYYTPNGVFGPEVPEERTTCGSWSWGLSAFLQVDVTGEGTRDLLVGGTLPPHLNAAWPGFYGGGYGARSVEFGMTGSAATDLPMDLLQRYARLSSIGNEDVLEEADSGDSAYDDLFTGATRGGPSGDIQADINGDGLVDIVRLEPSADSVNGNPGEMGAFVDSDPRLACKSGTAEADEPARAAVYFNRGDGSFERGPTLTGFVWQDYCRRFMQAAVAFDADGDGRSEVLLPTAGGVSFEMLQLNDNGGLEVGPTSLAGPDVSWARQAKTVFVADVTGSGQASLVVARPDTVEGERSLYAASLTAPPDLLVSVTDGYGAQTHVEYAGAQEVFSQVDCTARQANLQPHTPRWPLVSAVVRPHAIGGGVQRNDVDLHRYRGWCNGAVAYGGGFEQHIETALAEVGSGVEPGVYRGDFDFPVAMVTTTRDDYRDRMGAFRGDVTKRESLSWFPGEGAFTYGVDEALQRTYVDDFLHEWGVDDFYDDDVGVPLWHPVGVMVTGVSESSTFYTSGACTLVGGMMECEASSESEPLSHSRVERSFDSYGAVQSSSSTSGDFCSDYEVLEWAELPFVRMPEAVVAREGKVDAAGACDFDDASLAPFELHERWEFDSNGKPELHAVAEGTDIGVETAYSWDSDGTLHTQTVTESQWGGQGRTWEYGYDSDGNVDSIEDPLGHTTLYSWVPSLGLPVGIFDSNDVLVTTRYDGFGRVTGGRTFAGVEATPMSPGTTNRYERVIGPPSNSPSPLRLVSTDASGAEFLAEFDEHGTPRYSEADVSDDLRVFTQVRDVWTGGGARIETSTPAAVGDSPGPFESVEYDLHGRELLRTPATADLGVGQTSRQYGPRDVVEQDGNDEVWVSTSGDSGELVSTFDAEGILTCFYYGAGVRLRDVVVNPASGECDGVIPNDSTQRTSAHYTYDALGRTVSRKLPGRSQEYYEFRGFPELVRYEDGEHSIDYEYDGGGRLLSQTDENGTAISELEWDADADCPWGDGYLRRIKSEVSVDGTTTERTFSYDRFGRLASSVLELEGGSRQFRVDNRFDDVGRLAEVRHGGPGPRISYGHDGVGTLSEIRVDEAPVWTAASHDVSGRLDGIEFGNGLHEDRSYHAGVLEWLTLLADQPVKAYPGSGDSSEVVDSVGLEYDAVGRMRRKEIPHLGVEELYQHDDIGRLLRVDFSHDGQATAEIVHEYSPVGSILSRSGIGNFNYTDPARPLSVTAAGTVAYAYDTNGRQTDRNGVALTWNAWSKLDHVYKAADELHVEFAYDGYGEKVRRTEFGPEPSVTYFADGLDVEIADDGETRRYRVGGPEGVVAVVVQSGEEEEILYAHGNEMGSTSVFTNQSGDVVERQDFDPFGRRRAPLGGSAIWAGDSEVDIGFTGHRREESFGLMDMRGRYYDPHLARFAGPDPIVSAPTSSQGYDPFSYVRNDPLTYVDPSGYIPVSGYAGDWKPHGMQEDGLYWFSCLEECGGLVGLALNSDELVEAAGGDYRYGLELMGELRPTMKGPLPEVGRGALRRANQTLSRRRESSMSPAAGPSLLGDMVTEAAYDATPGVNVAHDLDGLRQAVVAYNGAPTAGAAVGVVLATAAFFPGVGVWSKTFGKRFADVVHYVPDGFGLPRARAARDAELAVIKAGSNKQTNRVSTVVGAHDPATGKVAVGVKRQGCDHGKCAEDLAADALGNPDPTTIEFTEVIRPRNDRVIPRCDRCTATFGPE